MAIVRRMNAMGQVSYQVKVRDAFGRWMPSGTFPARALAERHERELLSQRDQGIGASQPELRDLTVGEYFRKWQQECRGRVSDGWKISQDQMARDYILPHLERVPLIQVRPQDIGLLLEKSRSGGLSLQTVKHLYSLLHKLFEDAVEHYDILAKNPVLGRYRPVVPKRERQFLTPQESWRLLEHCRDHYLGPAIWLQILSGVRPSEVQALRWASVDFERSQILIRAAYNKEDRLQEHPKQDDWGMAPMPEGLAAYLRPRRAGPEEFVARNHAGAMLPYETYLRALRRLCREAGLPEVTPHELRHSCTEIYVQAGATAEDIRRLLNQSSLTATARYMHRTDERLSGIASRIQTGVLPPSSPEGGRPQLRLIR